MSLNQPLGDDELALYMLRLLDDREIVEVERQLAMTAPLRERLAEVQAQLGTYAEIAEPRPVPQGAVERLMARIADEKISRLRSSVLEFPHKTAEASAQPRSSSGQKLLFWTGWAAAASFAAVAGQLYTQRRSVPPASIAIQQPAAPLAPVLPVDLLEQRDALAADVADQAKKIEQLEATSAKAGKQAATLRQAVNGQSSQLKGQAEEMAAAQAERDALRGTVAAQADQVSRLASDAGQARLVLQTLTDPAALRVTLIKPKSRPAPTGRATYVASKGTLVFLASSLAPLRADKVYQLWLMPADGSKPVSAGTFSPDARGNASVVYAQLPQSIAAKGFAVTVENQGGSLTPTAPIILAGNA